MLAGCPVCNTRYRLDERRIDETGIKLRCGTCRTIFRVRPEVPVAAAPPPPAAAAVRSSELRVLVAHDSAAFCASVGDALAAEPFDVSFVNDGAAAYAAILETSPDVAVLDVALPGMFGFEICEAVRQIPEVAAVKIILIASIFDKTKYKRAPESLYGADDYIEKHHIHDELAARIYRLQAGVRAAGPADESLMAFPTTGEMVAGSALTALNRELQHDEERLGSSDDPKDERESAAKLARAIVSDIMLYNQTLVEEGVRNGTFSALLAEQLAEGRALYERRVAASVRCGTAYFDAAVTEVAAKICAVPKR